VFHSKKEVKGVMISDFLNKIRKSGVKLDVEGMGITTGLR
jgi:hypothetical protein